jgi:hypothetical protein
LGSNLAHVILRGRGFPQETPAENARFVAALVDVTEEEFVRYCGGVPAEERPTLAR